MISDILVLANFVLQNTLTYIILFDPPNKPVVR